MQLADDDTVADEPRGVEPQALKDQAAGRDRARRGGGMAASATPSRVRQSARRQLAASA